MSEDTNIDDTKIEDYLGKVRANLGAATASEEEEVIREIAARIQKTAAQTGAGTEAILEKLGPAAKVAHGYRDAILIAKASGSLSPTLLLRASIKNGLPGVLAFLVGLAGYWFGGAVVISGALALLWSIFQYSRNLHASIGSNVLYAVLSIAVGVAVISLMTFLLRAMLRMSKRVRSSQ